MKVLILSSVRCGGRYFCEQLALNHNLKLYHEPNINTINYVVDKDNIIVKTCVHYPFKYDVQELSDYTKYFDIVFLLNRKNFNEHLISVYNMYENSHDMYTKYLWDDTKLNRIRKNKIKLRIYKEFISELNQCIDELSYNLNEDIIYYEDLYYKTDNVNLKGLSFKPDLSKKLRVDGSKKII